MKKGRKKKIRYIQNMPLVDQFSPRGKPGRPDEIELKIDHFEAVKLSDYQGYNQSEGSAQMGLSRPSFGRILREARQIIAEALVHGKIIRIRTSDVQVGVRKSDLPMKDLLTGQDARKIEQTLRRGILNYKKTA